VNEVAAAPAPRGKVRWMFWTFVGLMLGLTGLFITLGAWQLNRLAEKEALIAAVTDRMDDTPIPLPPVAEWIGFDPEVYNFRPVRITGNFRHDQAVLVFTSLAEPRGQYNGIGYWVMTPFVLDTGGTVLVNRGFVPERLANTYADDKAGPIGPMTLTGIGRVSETVNAFTPAADVNKHIDYVRDTKRLAGIADPGLAPVVDLYIDLPAGEAGALPQGGETIVEFPNNHLGYAITWFGFALLTPIMLVAWIWRQRRRSP
jgi:surfeit locus 1 family protein